jgi:hypothetical protein
MDAQVGVPIALTMGGMAASWGVWVSVSLFKQAQEIALLKREIQLMQEIKEVLDDIRNQLRERDHS